MIALAMFYNHVIRYMNKLAILMLKYEKEVQMLEKKQIKEGVYQTKLLISQ